MSRRREFAGETRLVGTYFRGKWKVAVEGISSSASARHGADGRGFELVKDARRTKPAPEAHASEERAANGLLIGKGGSTEHPALAPMLNRPSRRRRILTLRQVLSARSGIENQKFVGSACPILSAAICAFTSSSPSTSSEKKLVWKSVGFAIVKLMTKRRSPGTSLTPRKKGLMLDTWKALSLLSI